MSRTPRPSADRRRVDAPETWRSLEQRANDPKVREFIEREFPEGAAEPPRGISRRQALTLLGASLSLAGLAGCRRPEEEIVPFVRPPEGVTPGIPRRYATTMPFGQSAFGLVVHSHEGRPTKIEGNENHPSTLGSSNTLIQASILTLYDPDRSQRVLEAGQPTDWDAFVAAWSALEQTHLEDGGTNLAVLSEPFHSPTLARLAAAFRRRFPQARWVTYAPVNDENIDRGIALAAGRTAQPVYRFERARVVHRRLDEPPLRRRGRALDHRRECGPSPADVEQPHRGLRCRSRRATAIKRPRSGVVRRRRGTDAVRFPLARGRGRRPAGQSR
jgi:molybdopterin-containing oxidoreductase family iron-sulfur binding subunit